MEGSAEVSSSPPPAAETGTRPEARVKDTREQVLNAFNGALDILENTPEDKLTTHERAGKKLIKEVKAKTLDQDKTTFRNRFKDAAGNEYSQMESVPVDDLIDFLTERIKSNDLSEQQLQDYRDKRAVLIRNSKPYYRLGRGNPLRLDARVDQELKRLEEAGLTTGDGAVDKEAAGASLTKRRELILPRVDRGTEPPPVEPPPPITEPPEQPPIEPPPPVEPPQPPPTAGEVMRELLVANGTLQVGRRAAETAEVQLRNELRRGQWYEFWHWPRKIGMRVAEQFHRQNYIERARAAMLEHNNTLGDFDVVHNVARNAQANIDQERAEGKAKVAQIKSGDLIAGQNVVEATGELKNMMINDILRPVVEGRVTEQGQIQQALRDFVQNHQGDLQVQAVFGRDATQYGRLAEYFASDLTETAELVRSDIEAHRYAIDQLSQVVKINLANTSWAEESQANFNAVDRAVAWAESHQLRGWLLNPATIGAVASLASFGISRALGAGSAAANIIAPGAGMIAGAAVAGVRRSYDLKVDRAADQVEETYNGQVPAQGAPRREALREFRYNTASVRDLINGGGDELLGGGRRLSMDQLLTQDLSDGQNDNREAVVRRISEIKSRLDFSATEHVDLVTFEARGKVEQGRMQLVQERARARIALRNAGMLDDEILTLETRLTGEWNERFTQNREQQDHRFQLYRLRNAGGAALFGAAVGLAGGLAIQQGEAWIGRAVPGLSEAPVVGALFGKGQTRIEAAFGIAGPTSPERFNVFGVDLNEAFDKPKNFVMKNPNTGEEFWMAIHPEDINKTREITFLDTNGNKLDGPAMWLEKSDDGKVSIIGAGDTNLMPKQVQELVGGWDKNTTETHNLRSYMKFLTKGGVENTSDEVVEYGNFSLNSHDVHESILLNDEGKPYDVWAQEAGRLKPDGTPEVGKMSVTLLPTKTQFHGFLREDGSFDVDPKYFVDGNYRGNADINPTDYQDMLDNLKAEGWGVDTGGVNGDHISAPETFEYTPPEVEINEAPIIPIPFAPRHPLEPLIIPRPPENPYYLFGYEIFRMPDGSIGTLSDFMRIRSDEARNRVPTREGESEGEHALATIRDAFDNADRVYIDLSGAIGDAIITSAYIDGIRKLNESEGKDRKITLIATPLIESLLRPTADKYGYELIEAPRGEGFDKAKSLIDERDEQNPLVLDFEHYTGMPEIDTLPKNGLVIKDLFASSVVMYDQQRSGNNRFTAFFSDLLSIPADQRVDVAPRIELPENSEEIYQSLVERFRIDKNKPQITIILESSHKMKKYSLDNWRDVMDRLSRDIPNAELNIIYNPRSPEYDPNRLREIFNGIPRSRFVGGDLDEMAVLLSKQQLVVSNDTGLAHVAATLEGGPRVLTLHVPVFPPNAWVTNSNRHVGLLPRNESLTNDFNSEESDESKKWINKITPEEVVRRAVMIYQNNLTSPPSVEETTDPVTPPPAPRVRLATPTPEEEDISPSRLEQLRNNVSDLRARAAAASGPARRGLVERLNRAEEALSNVLRRRDETVSSPATVPVPPTPTPPEAAPVPPAPDLPSPAFRRTEATIPVPPPAPRVRVAPAPAPTLTPTRVETAPIPTPETPPPPPAPRVRVAPTTTVEATSEAFDTEAPISSGNLLESVNEKLTNSSSNLETVLSTPSALTEFLKTLEFNFGAKFKDAQTSISGRQIIINNGVIEVPGGEAKFNGILAIDPQGKLTLLGEPKIDLPFHLGLLRGKVNDALKNLDQSVRSQINKRIDQSWEVSGFNIDSGNLAVDFRRQTT